MAKETRMTVNTEERGKVTISILDIYEKKGASTRTTRTLTLTKKEAKMLRNELNEIKL